MGWSLEGGNSEDLTVENGRCGCLLGCGRCDGNRVLGEPCRDGDDAKDQAEERATTMTEQAAMLVGLTCLLTVLISIFWFVILELGW